MKAADKQPPFTLTEPVLAPQHSCSSRSAPVVPLADNRRLLNCPLLLPPDRAPHRSCPHRSTVTCHRGAHAYTAHGSALVQRSTGTTCPLLDCYPPTASSHLSSCQHQKKAPQHRGQRGFRAPEELIWISPALFFNKTGGTARRLRPSLLPPK